MTGFALSAIEITAEPRGVAYTQLVDARAYCLTFSLVGRDDVWPDDKTGHPDLDAALWEHLTLLQMRRARKEG